ncbi:hypothetical protein Gotur_021526, partial [Gossypium turneri]
MGLLLVQVRRCQSSYMIFPLCLPHPHLNQMRMLVVANTQNVTVDLRIGIPLRPHHRTINF